MNVLNKPDNSPFADRTTTGRPLAEVSLREQKRTQSEGDREVLDLSPAVLEKMGLRASRKHLHQQQAEYRHVKRQLVNSIKQLPPVVGQTILVTSALAGDGKTHSAFNLAFSLSKEPDFTVLLVDADVIEPKLSRSFGLDNQVGFMEAVTNPKIDPEALIVPTTVSGLSILPAGQRSESATEYFASDYMRKLLAVLARPRNRIVVIDSLPLLLTTEARVLLPLAGQAVLVVRANVTPQSAVEQAVQLFGEHEQVNLLLNDVDTSLLGTHVYSSYHYRYGYGDSQD
jgi:protein-tyrosine kinase